MTLYDMISNWDDLSDELKTKALVKMIGIVMENQDDFAIKEILIAGLSLESDDYFGTEGLEI